MATDIDVSLAADGERLRVRVPQSLAMKLNADLRQTTGQPPQMEISESAQLVEWAVFLFGSGTTLRGLAKFLVVYFHRNDGKSFSINGKQTEIKGYSVDEVQKLLTAIRDSKKGK